MEMKGMEVTASTGVMSSLLSKLTVLLSDQYKLADRLRRNIQLLTRELTDMNAALVKLADREKLDVQTKVWRDKVREMAYDIEDIIDIFMHHYDQAGDDKDGRFQIAGKMRKTARKIRKLRARFQIAGMIQDIKVEESISQPKVVEVDPRLRAVYGDVKRLVAIDGQREAIIKWLMKEDDREYELLTVLPIVGIGGLGKTTLANQLYARIRNEFECTAFVSVSRTPHMPHLLNDIISKVGYGGMKMEDDVGKLIEILRATLTNKRYFIVIDDLWNIEDWDIIKCAFVENNNASRVITTTRSYQVGSACSDSFRGMPYMMVPLDEFNSRMLFFKMLFDTEDSCPEQFREISKNILRKCKGVPLAITTIASLLANHMHIEIWEKIHNSLGEWDTYPTLEWMKHVLNVCYNDLSHELKACFLYLGMYPEDYEIPKEDLVRKWMAEGFVREKHGLDLEEAAENCFNELINRSMIQPSIHGYGFGEVLKCQVQDLILDLIISKCKEENFITIFDRKYPMNGASQIRRISHQFHNRDMPLAVESMNASTVRSYISFPVADCMPPLSKFELLRVLDMEHSFFMAPTCLDLSAINHLFLLRYVRVQGFRLELPKKFGKLKHLMTLDVFKPWLYGSSEQLSDFSSLSSLRHLMLPGHVTFKNGLSKLCNLRDLSWFDIGTNSIECIRDLGELANLRNLSVRYGGIENNPKAKVLFASLDKLLNRNLSCLEFEVMPGASHPSLQFWWSNCLACPRHLQTLILSSVIMPKLPNWIAHADRLAHAELSVQELRSDDIQVLGQLPCLIYLNLKAETIPEENIIIRPGTFPCLQHFQFFCDELSGMTFESAAMPRLQRLEMELDAWRQGAMQLQVGCPVGGIEHLVGLEEISLVIHAKCNEWSKTESAFRDAISRHLKSQYMKIDVSGCEYDENRNFVRAIRNTVAGTRGEY